MLLNPIRGFRSLATHHCISGSMLHIYDFFNYDISEDMLLGLGAGVGFSYWYFKGTSPFYGGRVNVVQRPSDEGLPITAGRRTGVEVDTFTTTSPGKAERVLLGMLTDGTPTMIHVDMGYLPYFDFGGEEYHFGGHGVVVSGYDSESQQVLIADRDLELHPVSLEILAKARGSKHKPFPPKHRWYVFDFSQARLPRSDEIRQAIAQVTHGMLEPPISNLGVKGIRKAIKRTLKWPEILSIEELQYTCFNIYIFIDATGGTGGGIFRYMYGRFLKEAAEITGESRLADVGNHLKRVGDRWQEVAVIFKQASEDPDPAQYLPQAIEIISGIAEEEETAWTNLREIVGKPH